jgi:hypothetical protein
MTPVLNDELRKEVLNSKKFLQWRTYTKSKSAYGRGEGFK